MPLMITAAQYLALELRQLHVFAAEIAATLEPILAARPSESDGAITPAFAIAQIERARTNGLKRRNELMAWTLCAAVHGDGFERRMPELSQILNDRNYDRSMLLTLLAMRGLREASPVA